VRPGVGVSSLGSGSLTGYYAPCQQGGAYDTSQSGDR